MFAAGAAWRFTGLRFCGRTLVRGLASPDETVRTIAGILLVRAGGRSGPLLDRALAGAEPAHVPMQLRILGELGDERWDGVLERYSKHENPKIADAARDAIQAARFARQDRQAAGR